MKKIGWGQDLLIGDNPKAQKGTQVIKHLFWWSIGLMSLAVLFLLACNVLLVTTNQDKIFEDITTVPYNDVSLVLGTNPIVNNRYVNPYFTRRIEAAAHLYHHGKVKHLIVSGDNGTQSYNEPSAMRDSLVAHGVPATRITLDYAGFRTLDSVVRCKKVFQQNRTTIVSQAFHNYRALQIAKRHGINAVAFCASKPYPQMITKPEYREFLARCKAVLDLYVIRKQPKFLGEKVNINIQN